MSDKLFYRIEEEKETDKNEKTDKKNYKEGLSAFAKELPEWSIEPLQIVVKRGR